MPSNNILLEKRKLVANETPFKRSDLIDSVNRYTTIKQDFFIKALDKLINNN